MYSVKLYHGICKGNENTVTVYKYVVIFDVITHSLFDILFIG